MNIINCIIVDDEPLARDIINMYVTANAGWRVVKSCVNATEAYAALHEQKIDVMFLDIQMPVISGIEFLRSLKHPPYVVFTTAHAGHAVEGFALNAVDYLLKPITQERFQQAMDRVEERRKAKPSASETSKANAIDYFFIKQDTRLVKILFCDFLFAEAQRDFSYIYLKQKKILASMHLKLLEELLPGNQFVRVHRSFLINLSAISTIHGNTLEIDKHEIPIGSSYKEELFQMLGL